MAFCKGVLRFWARRDVKEFDKSIDIFTPTFCLPIAKVQMGIIVVLKHFVVSFATGLGYKRTSSVSSGEAVISLTLSPGVSAGPPAGLRSFHDLGCEGLRVARIKQPQQTMFWSRRLRRSTVFNMLHQHFRREM